MAKRNKTKQAGSFNYLIQAISQDKQGNAWLKEQILEEGPPHKIAQHSLVLQRLSVLLNLVEVAKNEKFRPVSGDPIILAKHDHELELPIGFPQKSLAELNGKSLTNEIVEGPDHEIAYTAILLQAIEWMIEQAGI